ncbi:MAG: hypothetical protein L0387_39320 [Acidobacteria bacterium]|nr:hypothetical protein [Acidobacteriota bacterium]
MSSVITTVRFIVSGKVSVSGEVFDLSGYIIRAFDKDLRSEELLGEAVTNVEGTYQISYTGERFRRAEKGTADLFFRIFDPTGAPLQSDIEFNGQPLNSPFIIFNAPISTTVNFKNLRPLPVPPPPPEPSEYEKHLAALSPILEPEGVQLADVTDDDIAFLAPETSIPQEHIELLRRAARLARETEILAEAFYGWGRKIPALTLEHLLARSSEDLREILLKQIAALIIPQRLREFVDAIITSLDQLRSERAFREEQNRIPHEVVGQLLNQEIGEPVVGYRVHAFDLDRNERDLGVDVTDGQGFFTVVHTTAKDESVVEGRRLRFVILDPQDQEIHRIEERVKADPQQVLILRIPVPAAPEPPSPKIEELLVELPPALRSVLTQRNIQTLADIRSAGGIGHLVGADLAGSQAVKTLEAHADLNRISPNIAANQDLIRQGYTRALDVARTARSVFVTDAQPQRGDYKAAEMQVVSRAQTHFLNNVLFGYFANKANGGPPPPEIAQVMGPSSERCQCRDCEAMVSPVAYLADLLDYAVDHVENGGAAISLQFLTEQFHQRFGELAASCSEASEQVRQVRLCIEVLRSYLKAKPPAADKVQPLEKAQQEYRLAAYTTLLNRFGTSYEEVRLAKNAKLAERDALAERLGIELEPPRAGEPRNDQLDQLLLDPEAQDPNVVDLTEEALERLFGLVDTNRYPLSDGITDGDAQQEISRWNLDNVEWGLHTDPAGRIYLSLKKISNSEYHIELYLDKARAAKVAEGIGTSPSGPVDISAQDFPDFTGRIEIDYKADTPGPNDPSISLLVVPEALTWRLRQLRTVWKEQDQRTNAFVDLPSPPDPENPQLPLIDPDVIGPDDFRYPYADANKPFDLWIARRKWVDAQLANLRITRESSGLTSILKKVLGDPLPNLDLIDENLTQSNDPALIKQAKEKITELHLTVESFTRLMVIRGKDERKEKIEDVEWEDLYSILVQAQKLARHPTWISEETGIRFGPEHFWIAIKPPKEGVWPPVPPKDKPWIDPEKIKLDELPEATAGRRARVLWNERIKVLDDFRNLLTREHKNKGFNTPAGLDAILELAFITIPLQPDPATPPGSIKEALKAYNTAYQNNTAGIKEKIESNLYITVDDFERLMRVIDKQDSTDPQKVLPSLTEWNEVYGILTSVSKGKHLYPDWIKDENTELEETAFESGKAAYWGAVKAKLPLWRASTEARQAWLQALRARSRPPIIDPDLIEPTADLIYPSSGPAYELRKDREDWINTRLKALDDKRKNVPPLAGFEAMLLESLFGAAATEPPEVLVKSVIELEEENQKGNDITPRLEQLNLSMEVFSYLLRIHKLAKNNSPITDAEWTAVEDILVQVEKQRKSAEWRDAEKEQGITHSPDYFRIPLLDTSVFPPEPPVTLANTPWRATVEARQEWQDTLQTRIDQQQAMIDAWRSATSATEEETLPALRNALVMATDAAGVTLDDKTTWVADNLLIDARNDGCAMTTRIAQAIETIQSLVFGVRTAQLTDTRPGLTLDADDFEEEWKWIGSFATYRAAMFVFAYPENILLPSFRKHKTPAFAKLIGDLRSNRNLTPGQACTAAKEYSDYFRDVCHLDIKATCQARTRIYEGEGCERTAAKYSHLFYMFAIARTSHRVYWSAYDPSMQPQDYAQTYWAEVPALKDRKVIDVMGAVAYRAPPEQRYIFLFVQTTENAKQQLLFIRYDLENKSWIDNETKPLDLPKEENDEPATFVAVVKQQDQEETPPQLFIRLSSGTIFSRTLSVEGTSWAKEGNDGSEEMPLVNISRGAAFIELCAAVETEPGDFYMFARTRAGLLQYRLFGANDDGFWREPFGHISRDFRGTFRWPFGTDVFVFYGNGRNTLHTAIKGSDQPMTHEPRIDLGLWLRDVAGLNLGLLIQSIGEDPNPNRPLDTVIAEVTKGLESTEERWKEWIFADKLVRRFTVGNDSLIDILWRLNHPPGFQLQTIFLHRDDVGETSPFLVPPGWATMSDLHRVASRSWDGRSDGGFQLFRESSQQLAIQLKGIHRGLFRCSFLRANNDLLTEKNLVRITPTRGIILFLPTKFIGVQSPIGPTNDQFEITNRRTQTQLQTWRSVIEGMFAANEDGPETNLTYLKEAYYFVPVHLAMQLQARGHYTEALDWFRTCYDYTVRIDQRKIYFGLKREESLPAVFQRADNWLLDPLDPHSIAETRQNTYTRFTLLSVIRCLLAFADDEFTLDTSESVPKARALYTAALELLDTSELIQKLGKCDNIMAQLGIGISPDVGPALASLKRAFSHIPDTGKTAAIINEVKQALVADQPWEIRLERAKSLIHQARLELPASPTLTAVATEKPKLLAQAHAALLRSPAIAQAMERVGAVARQDFLQAVSVVSKTSAVTLANEQHKAELPWLREPLTSVIKDQAITSFAAVELVRNIHTYVPTPVFHFCIPPNPLLKALRFHAEVNLLKIRTCRNIAGKERQLEPYAAATDTLTGLPIIGAGGNLVLPGTTVFRPTPYRYAALIERAKQLVQLAMQIEAAMLSALEKRDVEAYSALKARQEVRLARAGVRLQDLRVKESQDGVTLAELQQERAQIQVNHYQQWINEGLNTYEIAAIVFWSIAVAHEVASGLVSFTSAQYAAGISSMGQAASTQAQIFSFYASHERRKQEWELSRDVAQQDVRISVQQVRIANDHVRVTEQERVIAGLQSDHAEATVDFLSNKFTNVELYDWMSGVLEGVYSFFLQQATAMAKLAENQLAFERQEVPPAFIQADYWEAPSDEMGTSTDGNAPNRHGLTGSARLLQDIYQLDQHAFETNKRKLQLTKTISLAQMAPAEFQLFRETGVMKFETPMAMFDRDFPGHYLRLIKRVRTSVVALIPPSQGIRATLSSLAVSRVVIGPEMFQTVVIRRPPESIALSSPRDATGLFELTPQMETEMLLPFEGLGVDTRWEFRLPKPANLFDYSTIADVLVTWEYTALNSFNYYQQVIQSPALTRPLSLERPFSFRQQLADQWYDLNNPEQTKTPMTVRFKTTREDFAPNLDRLKIQHVALYFARIDGKTFEVPVTHLKFIGLDGTETPEVGSTSKDGIISTRRGNASGWLAMQNLTPFGEWELALPNTGEMRNRFKNEEIEDMLFVVTYQGRTPPWPA